MHGIFTLFLLVSLLHDTQSYSSGVYDCPSPWLDFGDSCYRFVSVALSIDDAKSDCSNDGANLIDVINADENNFVISWLSTNANDGLEWFTGGIRDPRSNAQFIWENNQQIISGQQFWITPTAMAKSGNRIVYYTDGNIWGWSILNDQGITRPYVCQIGKDLIYRISTVTRGFDFGVAEIDPLQLPRGPTIITQPVDVIYDPASAINVVIMNCEADALPLASYIWIVNRNLRTIQINMSDPSITVTSGRLSITNPVDTVHNGIYQCIASNSFGSVLSNTAQLTFGYLNDFPKSQRDPVVATAFTGIGIECIPPTSGYAMLSYAWYKDSILNFIRPSVKWYAFVSSDSKLYFQFVTKDDEGSYYCVVTRPDTMDNFQEGKISMPIPLQVIETVGSEQEPTIVNSFPKAFPSSPQVGNDVRVECVAWGTSVSQMAYSWNRTDGKLMPSSANFSDYNRVMTLPNIQLVHGGRYRCTVSRQLGQQTAQEMTLAVESIPYFTMPIDPQFVNMGSIVRWRCMAAGVPEVSYAWYVNNTFLNASLMTPDNAKRFTVANNVLTITNAQFQDSGMYQCAATNTHGTRWSTAQLKVLWFPPNFQKYPVQVNTYGTINGNVSLTCNPESAPDSDKVWFKNGAPISTSGSVTILQNGNLFLTQISTSDQGNYTCQATNQLGQASSTGELTVLPATTISQPPRDTVVMVNQTAFFHCEASYNPAIDITYDWWHNSYKIMFIKIINLGNSVWVYGEPNYYRGTGINRGGLYVNNTQFYHAGAYTCIAKSTTDEVSIQARLTVIGPPGEPAGVMGSNVGPNNITLTWWPGKDNGSPITSYVVEALNPVENFWVPVQFNIPPSLDPTKLVVTTVTGLNPYTQYQFRASGINALGQGTPSKPSSLYRTTQAPPVVIPQNLGGGGGKIGTLNISWTPIALADWNAALGGSGYVVYWKRWDMDETQWDNQVINDTTASQYVVTIGQDMFYTMYNVKVRMFNPMGVGPMSATVNIMSAEDLPKGVPIGVRAVYYNATAITVEWTEVANTRDVMRGVLEGYRINYWIAGEETQQMALFKIIRNQTTSGLIIGLRENTYYLINVQAINTAGNGPQSEIYMTRTLRAAPKEAPQEVRVSVIDHQSVLIKWRGVYTTITEEPLNGYMVRYWKRGQNIYVATNMDAGRGITYILTGLEQFVQYELRVYGYSRGGDGLQSSPTLEFILGPKCQIVQDSPDKDYIYLCSACCRSVVPKFFFIALLFFIGKNLWPA